MQKAALSAGLRPVTLEPGKHAVYIHNDCGPARETMIHMTSLNLPEPLLWQQLKHWPPSLKQALLNNLLMAFSPPPKNLTLTQALLPCAKSVSQRVEESLSRINYDGVTIAPLNRDLSLIAYAEAEMVIVKPDASGFITAFRGSSLSTMNRLAWEAGLQVVTCYEDVGAFDQCQALLQSGMSPCMIRPWQKRNLSPSWQVGWRLTMNSYEQCLHELELTESIVQQLFGFVDRIKTNIA